MTVRIACVAVAAALLCGCERKAAVAKPAPEEKAAKGDGAEPANKPADGPEELPPDDKDSVSPTKPGGSPK